MTPYDCYRTYLAVKNHFTKEKFDFLKVMVKQEHRQMLLISVKISIFEKLAHYRNDVEVTKYFLAYFLEDKSWVGDMVHDKGEIYDNYMSKMYDLENTFRESSTLFESEDLQKVFECKTGQHPPVLKKFLNGKISIETMVIYDKILMFCKDYDKTLLDPVWETVSLKIRKYKPFLNIDVFKYKTILREVINV